MDKIFIINMKNTKAVMVQQAIMDQVGTKEFKVIKLAQPINHRIIITMEVRLAKSLQQKL